MNNRLIEFDTKNFKLIYLAIIVGIVVGIVSSIFRIILNYIEIFRTNLYANAGNSGIMGWVWPILFAVIGISVSLYLVKKYAPEASGSGVQEIEGTLDGLRPIRWRSVLPIKFLASLLSLGSGLLLGREGPTVQLGGNIGKMLKDVFKEPDNENNSLVSSGAAAGLASAFNAPFAGIIFVIEEMHEHFKFNFYSVSAIIIASGTGDFVVKALVNDDPVIQMAIFPSPKLSSLWMFIILGLLFSLIGYFYNKLLIFSLDVFKKLSKTPILILGSTIGIIIVFIGVFYPDMISGGYNTFTQVLNQSFTFYALIVLFVIRMLLSAFSYGTGAPGGIFAPMLVLGIILGMLFGSTMQHYFPSLVQYPGVFAVAGMAAMFAATVRAPLTGLMLAVEMTSNFELILPLIITTVTASVFTALLGNQPIYTTLLKRTLTNT